MGIRIHIITILYVYCCELKFFTIHQNAWMSFAGHFSSWGSFPGCILLCGHKLGILTSLNHAGTHCTFSSLLFRLDNKSTMSSICLHIWKTNSIMKFLIVILCRINKRSLINCTWKTIFLPFELSLEPQYLIHLDLLNGFRHSLVLIHTHQMVQHKLGQSHRGLRIHVIYDEISPMPF